MNLIKEVFLFGNFVPGEIKGKKINVRCYIEIDMLDEMLNKLARHLSFEKQ